MFTFDLYLKYPGRFYIEDFMSYAFALGFKVWFPNDYVMTSCSGDEYTFKYRTAKLNNNGEQEMFNSTIKLSYKAYNTDEFRGIISRKLMSVKIKSNLASLPEVSETQGVLTVSFDECSLVDSLFVSVFAATMNRLCRGAVNCPESETIFESFHDLEVLVERIATLKASYADCIK